MLEYARGSHLVQMCSRRNVSSSWCCLGNVNIVKVVEAVDRVTKSLVVLFFNEEVVISIVNGFNVELWNATLIL